MGHISFIHFKGLFPDYLDRRMWRYALHPFLVYIGKTAVGVERIGIFYSFLIMARFRVTTKHVKNSNGIRIEPGMSVEVVTQSMSNPVTTNGGQAVIDAFYRIYGIDIKRAGILSMSELSVEQL